MERLLNGSGGLEFFGGSCCERSERFCSRVVRGSSGEPGNPFVGRTGDGSATGRHGHADRSERQVPKLTEEAAADARRRSSVD